MSPGNGTLFSKFAVKVYLSESRSLPSRLREALANSILNGLSDEDIVKLGEDGEPESVMIHWYDATESEGDSL